MFPLLQRMQYVTQMLRAINNQHGIRLSREVQDRLAVDANIRINGLERQDVRNSKSPFLSWFDGVVQGIAAECGVAEDVVRTAIRENAWITDALKYVQFGNPECIRVFADDEEGVATV